MVNIWLINGISTNVISNIYMNISLVEYVYPLLWLSINGIYGDITVFYMELIWNSYGINMELYRYYQQHMELIMVIKP